MHEFDLTRDGVTYRLGVERIEMDIIGDTPSLLVCYQIRVTDFDGVTTWRPLKDVFPKANCLFDATDVIGAIAAIGSQTIANASAYRTYQETLAAKLATRRWSN